MNKNVLVLSASPRKGGNSDLLCDQFVRGARDAGNEAEKVFLREKKINFCLGCGSCQSNGGTCVQKDDMDEVLEKMLRADVLVMATPIYFYSMNAQLKTLIDRTCCKYTMLRDKKAYLIATSADSRKESMDAAMAGFRGFLACLDDVEEAGVIYGTGVHEKGEIKGKEAMKTAYEMGRSV